MGGIIMKKRIICLFLICLLLLTCGCAKTPTEELYNYEVTAEPFESMEIRNSYADYISHKDEQELFEKSDMVFIGMPLETFTDGKARYFDRNAKEVDKNSSEIFYHFTVRDIKVLEMIKGDSDIQTVPVAEYAAVKEYEDGIKRIVGLPVGCSIAKKNVKYVYYVTRGLPEEMNFYFTAWDGGLANIDGLHTEVDANNYKLEETKARLTSQFEKYDRSAELKTK